MQDEAIHRMLAKLEDGRIYEIKEVAGILPISARVIYNLVTTGEIEAFRFGGRWKIPWSSLEKYIRNSWMAESRKK